MASFNILLCSEKMDLVKLFYEMIGIKCVQEQHGAGPTHFTLQGTFSAVEIYPPRQPSGASIIIRIDVENVDASLKNISDSFTLSEHIVEDAKDLKTGRKAIVTDPDGRVVELFQPFMK